LSVILVGIFDKNKQPSAKEDPNKKAKSAKKRCFDEWIHVEVFTPAANELDENNATQLVILFETSMQSNS